MGKFLLAMAQERAKKEGIGEGTVIRHGAFHDTLKAVVLERGAAAVVLGYLTQDIAVTSLDYINSLAQYLQEELSVEVYVSDQGDNVKHYRPLRSKLTGSVRHYPGILL